MRISDTERTLLTAFSAAALTGLLARSKTLAPPPVMAVEALAQAKALAALLIAEFQDSPGRPVSAIFPPTLPTPGAPEKPQDASF